jgi:pSer/pThr/pTyr-binding forkhead associated (FHA) protein
MIPKTVRYCIQCGREIGDAATCDACGGLPNFYRNIPGPQSGRKPVVKRPPTRERPVPPAPAGVAAKGLPISVPLPPDRRTVSIDTVAVAFLRSTGSSPREEPLLPGATEIGARPPAKIIIDRPEVSSRHARIDCTLTDQGAWTITVTDHKSTNGTFVNGKRIQRARLKAGDRLRIGKVEFEVRLPSSDAGPA